MSEIYREPKITSPLPISRVFNLNADDLRHRANSFVSEKALRLAGVRRVNDDVGHQILAKNNPQKDVEFAGLAIPYFSFAGSTETRAVSEWTIRRDVPDYKRNGAGEMREQGKYMKPAGAKNKFYVPPTTPLELLRSKDVPLIVTEGEIKALAIERASSKDFTSADLPFVVIGVSGVDNYTVKRKADTPHGERLVSEGIADFDLIELNDRAVGICFDSDLSNKPTVKAAQSRLARFLKEKGAKVFYINFPGVYQGLSTKGIDDYLGAIEAAHGTDRAIATMNALVQDSQKPRQRISPAAANFELIENSPDTAPGVYYSDTQKGENFRICSPIKVVAETSTKEGGGHGRLLEWRDSQNRLHRWAMPVEFLHSTSSKVAEYLAANGLDIMPSRYYHEKLAFYIFTADPEKVLVSTDKIGLHGECFVLPDKTFGLTETETVYQSEFAGHHKFKVAGTLAEWQNNLSKYCPNNSRLMFAVASAFAAPLLPIVAMQGGGFHFRGTTSTGKTTALFVGGSVCGGDTEHGFLQTWKATANGLEVVASAHNHCLLTLDEIGECDSREIGNIAYMLGNGRGKTRMTKTIQARHSLTWNLMFLSTGEQRLSDKITENGGTVKGGQDIRICDIEAETGVFGLFEDLHGFSSGQMFSDHLRSAACTYYGTALRTYLEWLMDSDFDEIRETWHGFKDKFIGEVLPDRDKQPAEVLRVAARFALVAFGGEMATEADVTKWEKGAATVAVKTVFRQWLNGREGGGQSDVERGIRQIRKYIQNYEQSRFQKLWATDEDRINERVGFVRRNVESKLEFLIFPDDFKAMCKGFDAKAVANAMKDRAILQTDGAGKTTKPEKITAKLSDKPGIAQRFYVVNENIFTFDEEAETKTANVW